jgi:hypothetical protein
MASNTSLGDEIESMEAQLEVARQALAEQKPPELSVRRDTAEPLTTVQDLLAQLVATAKSQKIPGLDTTSATALESVLHQVQAQTKGVPVEGEEEPFNEGAEPHHDEDMDDQGLDLEADLDLAEDPDEGFVEARGRRQGLGRRPIATATSSSSASSSRQAQDGARSVGALYHAARNKHQRGGAAGGVKATINKRSG